MYPSPVSKVKGILVSGYMTGCDLSSDIVL